MGDIDQKLSQLGFTALQVAHLHPDSRRQFPAQHSEPFYLVIRKHSLGVALWSRYCLAEITVSKSLHAVLQGFESRGEQPQKPGAACESEDDSSQKKACPLTNLIRFLEGCSGSIDLMAIQDNVQIRCRAALNGQWRRREHLQALGRRRIITPDGKTHLRIQKTGDGRQIHPRAHDFFVWCRTGHDLPAGIQHVDVDVRVDCGDVGQGIRVVATGQRRIADEQIGIHVLLGQIPVRQLIELGVISPVGHAHDQQERHEHQRAKAEEQEQQLRKQGAWPEHDLVAVRRTAPPPVQTCNPHPRPSAAAPDCRRRARSCCAGGSCGN